MFLERGYDTVTVAEVAREAGVSSVTVFHHFPRKEDLFLDRAIDAEEFLRSAVRDRRAKDLDVLGPYARRPCDSSTPATPSPASTTGRFRSSERWRHRPR